MAQYPLEGFLAGSGGRDWQAAAAARRRAAAAERAGEGEARLLAELRQRTGLEVEVDMAGQGSYV